jgi:hypothetical protein
MLFLITIESFIDAFVKLYNFLSIIFNALVYFTLKHIYFSDILSYMLDLFFKCILEWLGGRNTIDLMLNVSKFMSEVLFIGLPNCYNFIVEQYDCVLQLADFLCCFFICVFHVESKIVIFFLVNALDSLQL